MSESARNAFNSSDSLSLWAAEVAAHADFSDERLNTRFATVLESLAVLWITQLGGYLPHNKQMPGTRVLCRGWRDMEIMLAGFLLGK